uniref:Uncharacterized protein n=1 Tax=Photobacterium damselae subsp. damselae TaxID=85581 RepID=E4WLJ1_PHODD|nr:hypothetical protein [Photobacterium damselae subsp. damselae]
MKITENQKIKILSKSVLKRVKRKFLLELYLLEQEQVKQKDPQKK